MSAQLDSILQRSRSPGRFVERRKFTLSRTKAVEKLREFTLRRPEEYILELVQAAVFAGARWIAIDVSKERLFFAWVGGRGFTADQLENVFDYLFADRTAKDTRHVVQLAIALNALLQRHPKLVRVESSDGTRPGTVRMELDRHGKGVLGQPEDTFLGSYLVVEFTTSWFVRFESSSLSVEQDLVEQRCLYCPVPILLNNRAPFGYHAHRKIEVFGARLTMPFDVDGRHGVLAVPRRATTRDDGLRFVIGGVWITTHPVPELGSFASAEGKPMHLVGVLADDHLRKTADQAEIVEDARYVEMLHALQPTATRLIRRVFSDKYEPPHLPVLAAPVLSRPDQHTAAARGPRPEALPDPLPQVAPRPDLSLDIIGGLASGTPLFWVDPDTARDLGPTADPERFPFRLLILTPGQALTLASFRDDLSISRLSGASDAEFVARVTAQQADLHKVVIPLTDADGLGNGGRLHLRLHLAGPTPAWGVEGQDDLPVAVRIAHRPRWCGALHLGLPGVSVCVELDGGDFDPVAGANVISNLVRRSAWRLLADLPARDGSSDQGSLEPRPVRTLAVALLAMGLAPHFYRSAEGQPLALAIHLPRHWGSTGQALRTLPLAHSDQGPLSLDVLLDLITRPGQADTCVTLADADDLALLAPLELALGSAHLRGPVDQDQPLIAIARVRYDHWRRWPGKQAAPGPEVTALLLLGSALRPELNLPGWTVGARPAFGVLLAVRETQGKAETVRPASLGKGLRVLLNELSHTVRGDLWTVVLGEQAADSDQTPRRIERARQLGRLALISLVVATSERSTPALPVSDGRGWRPIQDPGPGEGTPSYRVAPRHGPRISEPDTVLLTWDEARLIEDAGLHVPLRFDDPPEVWDSLVEAESNTSGWLVRDRLRVPGLDGWLGLRWPYDPTSAVLVQRSGELVALGSIDRDVPCHGLAWTLGATDGVGTMQRDLLALTRLRLYQRLARQLDDPPDAAWQEAATQYATDFAVHAWRTGIDADAGGTAARLLEKLRLHDCDGQDLGSLADWLDLPPRNRPIPVGPAARFRSAERIAGAATPRVEGGYQGTLSGLEQRLRLALALASGLPDLRVKLWHTEDSPKDPAVRVRLDGSTNGIVGLALNEHHPLVYEALAAKGEAREVLLVEAVRVAAPVIQREGGSLDMLRAHQILGAQGI